MNVLTVYLSFLGKGDYFPCSYQWNGHSSCKTAYAQVAELELLLQLGEEISTVVIFGTKTSYKKHWNSLQIELESLFIRFQKNIPFRFETINEVLSTDNQWQDVQTILPFIPFGAEVILDVTHGFRSVPIVFSTALQFVQMIRNVSLRHVFYAQYAEEQSELIDYIGFYQIQEWTHAVQTLVHNADARTLSKVSQQDLHIQIPALSNSTELSNALTELTRAIRDVKVNIVESKAIEALKIVQQSIEQAKEQGDQLGRLLLETVLAKFEALAQLPPSNNEYNFAYVQTQLALTYLLLQHDFAMQAFTVVDELIGSIGMIGYDSRKRIDMRTSSGRGKRRAADVFKSMLKIPREKWKFSEDDQVHVELLLVWYEQLNKWSSVDEAGEEVSILRQLKDVQQVISYFRNGFNHAWTAKNLEKLPDPLESGTQVLERMRFICSKIEGSSVDPL